MKGDVSPSLPLPCTFHAMDATPLSGMLFEPLGPVRTNVLVAGALGGPQLGHAPCRNGPAAHPSAD